MSSLGDSVRRPASRLGKYEVIAKLGKGGMAQVHLAVVRGLGGFHKLVVLKWLDSPDEDFRRMFLDEARLAALLQHPNVVHTYEVSENAGSYFIAMEYLEGQPLDKVIRETKKLGLSLAPSFCARLLADALAGLHYTHELRDYSGAPLGVVHRDVSPHNLFVTYDGTVKVLDFGVAKSAATTAETDIGVLKGKLAYMAPEQAAARTVDRRADVFAAGAVLWELLTLQRLRRADSAAGVLTEAMQGNLPDLCSLRSDVTRQLEAVVWQALAQYPRRRFQTAQAMRDALLDYLAVDPCSHEEVAALMSGRFGELRRQMQVQVGECLAQAEAQDPVIKVVHEEDDSRGQSFGENGIERGLPILESGSLPARNAEVSAASDELTTPLGPEAMLRLTHPPSVRSDGGGTSRSRAITFTDEAGPAPETRWRIALLGALAAALALLLFWPQQPVATRQPNEVQPTSAPSGHAAGSVLLRLHGSNTIGQELAPKLVEAFLRERGFSKVERSGTSEQSRVRGRDPRSDKLLQIEIDALGSTTAFAGLASGVCDVGLSSRRIKPEETAAIIAKGLGDLESPAGEHVLGLDGIAVVVHPNSRLQRIDLATLRSIFTGESDAPPGGDSDKLNLYARDDRSGTFDTFKHLVLGERPLAPRAKRFADSVELSASVARDPEGIGFIGIPYVRGARALAVGETGAASLFPSAFTVATEGYGLSRRLYLYVPILGVKPLALDFVNFALSHQGQAIVRDSGFIDLTLHALDAGPCEHCPAAYAALSRSSKRVSLDFRFRKSSAEIDSRGLRDLDRLLAFLREHEQGRLTLVGFSDARGSHVQNSRLSLERARMVADALRERGVHAVELMVMGQEMPVASNDSEGGREKNRRVEVWIR